MSLFLQIGLLWFSNVCQTRETPKLLELAQKMMEKVVADDKIKNLESTILYYVLSQLI